MTADAEVVASGFAFPEAPRWHGNALWFSDMYAGQVLRLGPGRPAETVVTVPQGPSGLGFLPDGRLLVVSMHDRRVLRLDPDGLAEHADLSQVATWHATGMLVEGAGRAHVATCGAASARGVRVRPGSLALIQPDGTV